MLPSNVLGRRMEQAAKRRHRQGEGPLIVVRARMIQGLHIFLLTYLNVGRMGSQDVLWRESEKTKSKRAERERSPPPFFSNDGADGKAATS